VGDVETLRDSKTEYRTSNTEYRISNFPASRIRVNTILWDRSLVPSISFFHFDIRYSVFDIRYSIPDLSASIRICIHPRGQVCPTVRRFAGAFASRAPRFVLPYINSIALHVTLSTFFLLFVDDCASLRAVPGLSGGESGKRGSWLRDRPTSSLLFMEARKAP
jgi:hypothetical protein